MRNTLMLVSCVLLTGIVMAGEKKDEDAKKEELPCLSLVEVLMSSRDTLAVEGDERVMVKAKVCVTGDEKNLWEVTYTQNSMHRMFTVTRQGKTLSISKRQTKMGIEWEAKAPPFHIIEGKEGKAIVMMENDGKEQNGETVREGPVLVSAVKIITRLKKLFSQLEALIITPGGEKPNPLDTALEPFKDLLDASDGKKPAKKEEPKK